MRTFKQQRKNSATVAAIRFLFFSFFFLQQFDYKRKTVRFPISSSIYLVPVGTVESENNTTQNETFFHNLCDGLHKFFGSSQRVRARISPIEPSPSSNSRISSHNEIPPSCTWISRTERSPSKCPKDSPTS